MTRRNSRSAVWAGALLLALGAPAAAPAKEEIVSVVVCGADRCGAVPELDAGAASSITDEARTAPAGPAAFYDVFPVFREPGADRTTGAVLRYVPSLPAVRSAGGVGTVTWFRTNADLRRALDDAARGLAPRPATMLERPSAEIGRPAANARRAIAVGRTGGVAGSRGPADDDASISTELAVGGVLGAILILGLVAAVGRRTTTPTSRPTRRRGR